MTHTISSQPRYDHFDNSPYESQYIIPVTKAKIKVYPDVFSSSQ